jgi:hypothetical protein
MDCVIIGDSIAQGIGQVSTCATHAKVGATSSYITRFRQQGSTTIISAGSNDPYSAKLPENLRKIREKILGKVVWILPYNRHAASQVRKAAGKGDVLVDLKYCPTRDGVHPSSYKCPWRIINASRTS